jgi:hypothetical protein
VEQEIGEGDLEDNVADLEPLPIADAERRESEEFVQRS